MNFIRPELKQTIWRFRDALFGAAVVVIGLYWANNSFGFMVIVGFALIGAGVLMIFAGVQRARFRSGAGGSGVVSVIEGQVTYFGPYWGGTVEIDKLVKVELDATIRFASVWVLHDQSSGALRIPTNAEGAEALFDVFANLDGIQTERMLAALENDHSAPVSIWQARARRLH
ncbi:MAG: hypothetical protein ACC646_11305 [Paracoccaceae bacterium]